MKKDFINYDEYKIICRENNINDSESQEILVNFLNDLGVVLHFKDFELKTTQILNPEWLTTAVYKIINCKEVANTKGLLKLEHLDEILKQKVQNDYYYPQDKYRYIIELMQKFELCYEISSGTILIPDLLEVQEPEFSFDYAEALKFQLDYDFLPRSILPRFMVRMQRYIKNGHQWRNGVILVDKQFDSSAVVKSDNFAGKIYIYVQGKQRRDYLFVILHTLREINSSFEKLEVVEKVPLPDSPQAAVSYAHLQLLEQKGITEFIPEGAQRAYNVKDLLGTVLEERKRKEYTPFVFRNFDRKKEELEPVEKHFNTTGPVKPGNHYFIDPLSRINLNEIISLIRSQKYFVLHAPRQTGKTSLLLALMDYLNQGGNYKCLYINVEDAQAARENVEKGMKTILSILAKDSFYFLNDSFLKDKWKEIFNESGELEALNTALMQWCEISEKPVVLFIDEVDTLVGDTLISLLRQLRSGYPRRPGLFPQSVILCGVRDVRDYRIHSSRENDIITGGSAFNIKAKSLKLGNFNQEEIIRLYEQHTQETNQKFSENVFPLIWELTKGQPWLVNALAHEVCFELKEGQNREREITIELINQAKENLIIRRDTHIDQLLDKLNEERVLRVIEPILAGSIQAEKIPADDVKYTEDLGLITGKPQLSIANQIYKEVIPRELTYSTQLTIRQETRWYIEKDGRINMDKLLTAFQEFFRKHFESWIDGYNYKEAGPQLLLQAFLQRVLNDNGRVEREYGLGRQRTDLHIIWPFNNSTQEIVVELKLRYDSLEKTIKKGLEQTWEYMDKCGASSGYLLIFDRSKKKSWKEKIFKQERTFKGEKIIIYGM